MITKMTLQTEATERFCVVKKDRLQQYRAVVTFGAFHAFVKTSSFEKKSFNLESWFLNKQNVNETNVATPNRNNY